MFECLLAPLLGFLELDLGHVGFDLAKVVAGEDREFLVLGDVLALLHAKARRSVKEKQPRAKRERATR